MTVLAFAIYLLFVYGLINAVIDVIFLALYIIRKLKGRI